VVRHIYVARRQRVKKHTLVLIIRRVLVAGGCGLLSALTQNHKPQSKVTSLDTVAGNAVHRPMSTGNRQMSVYGIEMLQVW
jgi:hypothetical protein